MCFELGLGLGLGSVYCVLWVGLGLELVLQRALSWASARSTLCFGFGLELELVLQRALSWAWAWARFGLLCALGWAWALAPSTVCF